MLCMNVIEVAQSKWVSWIVFFPNKDSSLRVFIYYRKLNAMNVKEGYPIT